MCRKSLKLSKMRVAVIVLSSNVVEGCSGLACADIPGGHMSPLMSQGRPARTEAKVVHLGWCMYFFFFSWSQDSLENEMC